MKELKVLKILYALNEAVSLSKNYPSDELLDEAIAELEALQKPKNCNGCKYGKYGADSRGIEVECTLIWHCARGNGFPDRYEPKE